MAFEDLHVADSFGLSSPKDWMSPIQKDLNSIFLFQTCFIRIWNQVLVLWLLIAPWAVSWVYLPVLSTNKNAISLSFRRGEVQFISDYFGWFIPI